MKATRLLDEIRETNLSYLLLAQQLIREDRAEATFRLGISEEVADLIDQLTTAQVSENCIQQHADVSLPISMTRWSGTC